jgi:hypothetical protein
LAYDGCAPLLKQRAALLAAPVVCVCLHGVVTPGGLAVKLQTPGSVRLVR